MQTGGLSEHRTDDSIDKKQCFASKTLKTDQDDCGCTGRRRDVTHGIEMLFKGTATRKRYILGSVAKGL